MSRVNVAEVKSSSEVDVGRCSPKTSESDSSVVEEDCPFRKLFVGVLQPSELSHGEQTSSKELLKELLTVE